MNVLFLGLAIFIFTLFVIELTAYAVRVIQHPDRAEIRKRLRRTKAFEAEGQSSDITKKMVLSDVPLLNRILPALPGVGRLDPLMRQANVKYTLGFFILLSLALFLMGYLFFFILTKSALFSLPMGVASGSLPLLTLRMKKNKRMAKFEKQLPDGLGLLARSLRAGHAFTSGMKLASEEFGDPLGPEFEETLDEINFGVSVPEALKNLARRADCPDVNFFVVSVILQRETGGNLAEIIENLAHIIRERFRFRGKVRVLSAEGRLSAIILLAIPVFMFLFLYITQRGFLDPLFSDPIGKVLTWLAVGMMVLGYFLIRRIVRVEV
jgi:tight adherence protein B